jgi:hypothetical protein
LGGRVRSFRIILQFINVGEGAEKKERRCVKRRRGMSTCKLFLKQDAVLPPGGEAWEKE